MVMFMAIIGFNFTKINVERKKEKATGKIDIKNNVGIVDVEESKNIKIGNAEQKVLKMTFDFDVNYEPKIGYMKFTGEVVYLGESAKMDSLLKGWKKDKKLPSDIMSGVINTVLNKCNIQAVILSQQINLPSPVPMPKVKIDTAKK